MGLDDWQLPTVRNMLSQAWSVGGADLDGYIGALEVLRDAWGRPRAALGFPLWNVERGRELYPLEEVYLRVADLVDAHPEPSWRQLEGALEHIRDGLERIMVVAVCGHPRVAEGLAAEAFEMRGGDITARDRRWVGWIADRTMSTGALEAPGVTTYDADLVVPLEAALAGDWQGVLDGSTPKARKASYHAVTSGGKVLVQLARWRLGDERMKEKTLRGSFGRWFAYSYHRFTSFGMTAKMPFVYLFGRELEPGTPAALVARIGNHIEVLREPPSRTFQIPEAPRARLEELLGWAHEAREQGALLWTDRSPEGVEFLIGDETPGAHAETSFADL